MEPIVEPFRAISGSAGGPEVAFLLSPSPLQIEARVCFLFLLKGYTEKTHDVSG